MTSDAHNTSVSHRMHTAVPVNHHPMTFQAPAAGDVTTLSRYYPEPLSNAAHTNSFLRVRIINYSANTFCTDSRFCCRLCVTVFLCLNLKHNAIHAYNIWVKFCESVQWLLRLLFALFCRKVITLDWKKWSDLLDDLNDDASLSVIHYLHRVWKKRPPPLNMSK